MAKKEQDLDYQVRSVNRAVDILEMLVHQPDRNLTEIAGALDIPKSTCFNLLCTLASRGMLTADGTGRYRVGPNTIHLGGAFLRQMDVRRVARPIMDRLVAETRETSILAIWDEHSMQVYYIETVSSPESVALHPPEVGRRDPAHSTALGKVLLAALPEAELNRFLSTVQLRRFTPRTLAEPAQLRAHLEEVRRDGYSLNMCELDTEGGGIAAPVTDHTGRVVAALSLAGPAYRLTQKRLKGLIAEVLHAAAGVSRALGAPSVR